MFSVCALYSPQYDKIYIGYTSNISNRLIQHNKTASKGFTTRFRPWVLVYSEVTITKQTAIKREKQLKSAGGRRFIRSIIARKFNSDQ